ncbi:zinc transporter ZIP10 isoform X1 [Scophthalmus maximus]|uniref:zinc transporter ZIP10 isoform X1 n=2 Tax=Scophthalmus maximus TaxID=52904 RepID=UPI001FA8EF87|nr:zinc transporter ZIP10 isoform X1 [Scophthalmus maximus]XP_035507007.2 zinc transporter ZIP10 isoform X1 [Scophthalmus maximus]XP_035507009.2 zinc transporter ZIP10 isoform X1 [Scophthalmus maximus]XP_035507010.2 zinc transporter ZIP10 isoform X1 [Scophthalmus maximus]
MKQLKLKGIFPPPRNNKIPVVIGNMGTDRGNIFECHFQKSWKNPSHSSTRTGGPNRRKTTTGTRSEGIMRVHVHTQFCFLCVLTFLFHQCNHCHGEGHSHQHGGHHHADHDLAHSDLQISEAPYVSGATASPKSESPHDGALEEEQRFYIQQLFRRYGQKDQLDFQGFQSLLLSLGLGEVKVVDVDHEDLGHDHVAHLDLLDMQEGLHSHSSTDEGHDQGHGHGHGHPHNKPDSHHPHTEQVPTRCSQQASTVSPAAGAPTGHDHRHDAKHNHDHAKVKDGDHKHSDGHVQDRHDHKHNHDHAHDKEHKHEQAQVQSNPKDLTSQPHGEHDHGDHDHGDHDHGDHDHGDHDHGDHDNDTSHVHRAQTGTDVPLINQEQAPSVHSGPSQVPQEPQTSPAPAESRTKKPRNPARVRGQRGRNRTSSPDVSPPDDHEHKHEHSHGHSHKHRREAPGGPATPTLPVPVPVPDPVLSGQHAGGFSHQHEECLNLTQLLAYYGLRTDSLISPSQFTYLCPALLYQIDSRVCIRHYHQMDVEQEALDNVSTVWVWVWGFVSITIISLLSLLGVVLVPIINQGCFKFLLTFLVALAVGTLSGDALLHLLPHSQGQHDHSQPRTSHKVDMLTEFDGVWKGLTALAGIYLLFIIEHCIGMFKHYKDQRGMKKANEEGKIGRKLSDHKLNRRSDAEWLHLKPLGEDPDGTAVSCDNGYNDTQLTELQAPDSPTNKTPLALALPQPDNLSPAKESGHKAKQHSHRHSHGHGHSHGGNCHSDQEMKDAGIASIAWMVIMGDGMHNFSDGLAIGAAFSANLTGGISTSVAVFCHELPHELGDFAVLLKAGMSVKQAIVYNLLSALMAYVGMMIGTVVGQYTHNVTNWIFAITAGMFLYVALVDMLPEMLHGDSEEHKRCQLGHFVLQNMGMLTGFSIMLLIAIFEDRIVFDFGF